MQVRNLLPVGSVVILKNGEKKLMIIGIKQIDSDNPKKTFDYLGVLYPEGYIGDKFQYLFNNNDIDEVFFRGFEDEERVAFLNNLADFYGEF